MRKVLIILACALVVGAVLYQVLAANQGYVVVAAGPYIVETTLWGALVLFALALLTLYLCYKLYLILVVPKRWWLNRADRKKLQIRDRTAQGVLDYLEGNWPRALENLKKGVSHSDIPTVNYLAAAAASYQMGDIPQFQSLLATAQEKGVLDNNTAGLLRTRLLLQHQEFDKALALADTLHRKTPSHPSVLRLLAAARKGLRDWPGLELLLPDLKKHKALSPQELAELEAEVHREIISSFSSIRSVNKSIKEQQAELDHLWDAIPHKLQNNPELVAQYIVQLQLLGLSDKAENRLRRFINKQWDERLVGVYGDIDGDLRTQLITAEGWLKDHPDNPHLLAALGRLCMRSQLWGKAKEYFERSLKLRSDPKVWLDLGELHKIMQDTRGSQECYRNGLLAITKS